MLFGLERALGSAELFWVSPEMAELVRASMETLPRFIIKPEDIPAVTAVVMFSGGGIEFIDTSGTLVDDGGLLVHRAGAEVNRLIGAIWTPGRDPDGKSTLAIRLISAIRPEKYPPGWLDGVRYDIGYAGSFITIGQPVSWDHWLASDVRDTTAAVLSTMLLMQQPGVANVSDDKMSKKDLAGLRRRRLDPSAVRVIELRRKYTATGGGASGREYHSRWVVRGHWRNQWYPSRDGHKPIWIAPHVKGPEDAPLLTGEKVYAWTR
jgi:hypothetical protein